MEISRAMRRPPAEAADQAAPDLAALYDAYAGRLGRYLVTVLGNLEDAEDALHEVFLGLLRRPHQPVREVQAYLFRAAHNQAIAVLRRRKGSGAQCPTITWIDLAACDPEERDQAVDIDRALRQLPRDQREVFVLRVKAELTFGEIARVLGIPQNTAASRYRLSLARLRALLEGGEAHE